LPQVVIDGGMAAMVLRLLSGADCSVESVMNEVTSRVGFYGDFLRQKETSRRLRAGEVSAPQIATRATVEAWERGGRGPVLPAATRETLRAMAAEAVAAARANG
jgi:trimethylamine:corrinoid methyltransferase-like protein